MRASVVVVAETRDARETRSFVSRVMMRLDALDDDDDDLRSKLSQFDAANAQCYLPRDRDKLCAPAIRDASFCG